MIFRDASIINIISLFLKNGFTKDIMADVKSQNNEKLTFLKNKPPRWNEATQSHCLNFGGRVTLPSIKNFQLIAEKDGTVLKRGDGRRNLSFLADQPSHPLLNI